MKISLTYRVLPWWGALVLLMGCSSPTRDNPDDPGLGDGDEGIELIADLPAGVRASGDLLAEIRFKVTADDMADSVVGNMNLVGTQARGLVKGVLAGEARRFEVEVFDVNRIRTFSAIDTLDVSSSSPLTVRVSLIRLTGGLELTSQLPPEIVNLRVDVVIAGDTTATLSFEVDENLLEQIQGIPTGTGVELAMSGVDHEDQVLVSETVRTDIRVDLLARVSLPVETGAVDVLVNFPDFVPIVAIDRFSDSAAVFFLRSLKPSLPAADEPIDFDEDFLHRALGPNEEVVEFYHFDVQSRTPGRVYVLFDRRGDSIPSQLPLFDEIPGDAGYNDLRFVVEVSVSDLNYRANSITSVADLRQAGFDTTVTEKLWNCVMVPDGSSATRRFDPTDAVGLMDGWYRDQVVRYLLFENPDSQAAIEFTGTEVSAPVMYAFLENDRDINDGFAVDPMGATHNVVTRLPTEEGYAPLWALRMFELDVFDRVTSVASAQDYDREDNVIDLGEVLIINAPVVSVE